MADEAVPNQELSAQPLAGFAQELAKRSHEKYRPVHLFGADQLQVYRADLFRQKNLFQISGPTQQSADHHYREEALLKGKPAALLQRIHLHPVALCCKKGVRFLSLRQSEPPPQLLLSPPSDFQE